MADEVPGETMTEVPGEVVEEIKGERLHYGEGGEREQSLTESLRSDFCVPGEAQEEEQFGEGLWVCQEQKEEEFLGERWPPFRREFLGEEEEEEEITHEEKRSLDSQYLKAVLGTPLTFALLDIAMKRPTDPIQYLGAYLLKWRWGNENKAEYEETMKELNAERAAYIEKLREKERQLMLENEEKEEEFRKAEREESSLEIDDDDLGESHELELEEA